MLTCAHYNADDDKGWNPGLVQLKKGIILFRLHTISPSLLKKTAIRIIPIMTTTFTEAAESSNIADVLWKRPAQVFCMSSDSGVGLTDDSVSIDGNRTSSGIGDSTSGDSDFQETLEIALMVHISETKCRLTLLHENGAVEPYSGNNSSCSTPSFSIPFKMGIVRNQVLVFGDTVVIYEKAEQENPELWKQTFISLNLGEKLLDSSSGSAMKLVFDGNLVSGKLELFLGLYLHHLKYMVKTSLDSKDTAISHQVSKIIILVPVWFSSLHRQRLKDSAQIAGFNENFIVNATSALALTHLAAKRLMPCTPVNLLVFSENPGITDLTLYSCEVDKYVKLLGVTGNRNSFGESEDPGYKHSYVMEKPKCDFKIKVDQIREKNELKRSFLSSLLDKMRKKLPYPVKFGDCMILSLSDQEDWSVVLPKELQKNVITQYQHVGAPPVGITGKHWLSPKLSVDELVKNEQSKIIDLMPFDLHLTNNISLSGREILKIDGKVFGGSNGKYKAFPMESSTIYQRDFLGESWEVGTIQVKPILFFHHKYRQKSPIEMHLRQSRQGVCNLEAVVACDDSGRKKILSGEGDYLWLSPNLRAKEKEKLSLVLREILKCSEQYEVEGTKIIEQLRVISNKIADKIWTGKYSSKLTEAMKLEVDAKVNRTLELLNKSSTWQLIEVGRYELKKLLKDLQSDRKAYF